MGQGVDAFVAFGVDLGYDSPFEDEHEDLEALLVERSGLVSPYDQIPKELSGSYGQDAYAEYQKWIADNLPNFEQESTEFREAKKRLTDACPVDIDHYGSESEWGHIIYLKGTAFRGGWERVVALGSNPLELVVQPEDIERAQKTCDDLGIGPFEDPQWILYARLW